MRLILLPVIFLCLAACSSKTTLGQAFDSRANLGLCPVAGSIYDSARVVRFANDSNQKLNNVTYTGEITDVRINCRYAGVDPIRINLEIDFAFGKGTAASENIHAYEYFVAVTRPDGRVLNRVINVEKANFGAETITTATVDISPIIIPRADESIAGENFEVLVGFLLTDQELKFNREGRRFLLNSVS